MQQPPIDLQRSFSRPVYCILGLPFDAVSLAQAAAQVSAAVEDRRRCLLATPNVNFLLAARRDADFRNSVLASDLAVADGMPIVWLAGLLGLPVRERVAGASLFEMLAEHGPVRALRCFFFGGEKDSAERAVQQLNQTGRGLVGAGALNPGMGSAEELSRPEYNERINAADTDFLVVSLGAQKGQAWIMHNAAAIDAPVISHLGAVVNFYAGTVKRAPGWMQRCGLEWLWRIGQEPALFWRYLRDGLGLAWLVVTRILPMVILGGREACDEPGEIHRAERESDALRLVLSGSLGEHNIETVRQVLTDAAAQACHVELDCSGLRSIDAAFTGKLLLLLKHCQAGGHELRLVEVPTAVHRTLRRQGAEFLLS